MDAISKSSATSITFQIMPFWVAQSSLESNKLLPIERVKLGPRSRAFPPTFSALDLEHRLSTWKDMTRTGSLKSALGKNCLGRCERDFSDNTPQLTSKGRGYFYYVRSKVDHLNPSLVDNEVEEEVGFSFTPGMEELEQSDIDVNGFTGGVPSTVDISAVGTGSRETAENGAVVSPASQREYKPKVIWFAKSENEEIQFIDRAINASIAGAAGVFAISKVLTVDQNYWHGWTIFEILKYAPIHNWGAYEDALKNNPVLAKMMISGIVYAIGDWIAQCYEGKPILDFNRVRMVRSGFTGFCLHGSLSHFYYQLCEALFPFTGWWVVPLKVAFDQTIWAGIWNSIYFVMLGLLRSDSPADIFSELKATFFPLMRAGWKLWPFAHIITYGVVPVEQRLLWVDCVELLWVTILSMYSNEKAEKRILEAGGIEAGQPVVILSESEGISSEDPDK